MGAAEAIGIASSFSLLSGWRLYACVFVCGLAMRLGWLPLPENLHALDALASSWVLAAAALGFIAEFFADKVAWIDSIWDAVHTVIRPLGGALLALAVIDPGNTQWQVLTVLLGGGAALTAHAAKAGTRAMLNTSPEPVSNIVASTVEDGLTAGGLYLVTAHPAVAGVVATLLLVVVLGMLWFSWKMLRQGARVLRSISDGGSTPGDD
jgi:hypothetical protein